MKANVNYNLKGNEEPGVQGKAQNTKLTTFHARALNSRAPIVTLQNITIYFFLPHCHPRSTPRGQYWPSLVPPCQLHLNLESKLDQIWRQVSNI